MIIKAAGRSDVGRKRESNEDSYFLNQSLRLYGVADGMGGHQAGEVASGMVVQVVQEAMQDYMQQGRKPSSLDNSLSEAAGVLVACIDRANEAVHVKAGGSETKRGMGTTLSLVHCTDMTIIAANVGDSPVYLVRKGAVETLSQTHTVEAELALMQPDNHEVLAGRYHHMLTRAVGIQGTVEPSLVEVQCFDGDIVVICSDGLSNKVAPQEIQDVVTAHEPQEACNVLIGLANGRGGEDNITVIVLKIMRNRTVLHKIFGILTRMAGR